MSNDEARRTSSDLPPGWVWTTLGETTDTTRMRADPQVYPDARFVGMEHVEAHTMRLLGTVPAREMHSSAERFSPGDVLYGRLRPYLNKVHCPDFAGLCSGEFIVFRKSPHLASRYIQYFLNSADFVSFASHLNAGDRPRVSFDQLADYPFPLPPLPEQHRIVAEIEKQFTRLDAGVAALKRVQAKLKRYRASVLKAACEGRLAPQDPADEPADHLLARILAERRAKWQAEHSGKRYAEPAAPVTDGLLELPVGWCWATIEQLAEVGTGGTPLRSKTIYYQDGTVPWVTSGALNRLFVDQAEEFITERAVKETNAKVFPSGSLLVAMYGEGKTRGKVSELRIDAATNQACAILVFGVSVSVKPFTKLFLQKNYDDIRRLSSGGVQPNLNLSIVKQTRVPLPPLPEQHRIVAEVERRLSVVAALEATAAANLARAGRLRQAVLKRAFAGRLVPQEARDA